MNDSILLGSLNPNIDQPYAVETSPKNINTSIFPHPFSRANILSTENDVVVQEKIRRDRAYTPVPNDAQSRARYLEYQKAYISPESRPLPDESSRLKRKERIMLTPC